MAREWSCLRLSARQQADDDARLERVAEGMRYIAHIVSTHEPGVHWSFCQLGDGSFALWLNAAREDLDHVAAEARKAAVAAGCVAEHYDDAELSRRYSSCHTSEPARKLSAVSSEFALTALTDGGLPESRWLPLAVAHMRQVSGLIPDTDRGGFLFSCWTDWTYGTTPEQRVALAEWVAALSTTPEWSAEMGWSAELRAAWRRYLDTLRVTAIDPDAAGSPINYLLFEHAHLLHNRLGISRGSEALAARIVRSSVLSGHDAAGTNVAGATMVRAG